MAALFGHGNPLSTQVGQLIEQGTDGSQATENWALYMEVCDIINETDEGPKDAIKAFRKRISQNVGKSYTAVMYCLTCIESCVKNCGRRFHIQVANKDFLHDLIKIIGPKNDPPQIVQEKVLSMIQTWADAFRGNSELKEVEKVYQELKQKGIEFPMTDLENMAPIHTPARSVPEQTVSHDRGGSSHGKRYAALVNESDEEHQVPTPGEAYPSPTLQGYVPAPATYPTNQSGGGEPLNADQTTKLRRELEVVQGNIRVMGEMLTELSPNNVDSSDLELLQELNRTCRQMQSRIVELLNEIATEEITIDLLRVNDDLNNVFLRYERFERYRTGQSGQASPPLPESEIQDALPPPSYDQLPAASNPKVGNLIDLSDDPTPPVTTSAVNAQFTGLSLGANTEQTNSATMINATSSSSLKADDEFDMFAQSRQSFDQNKEALGTTVYSNHQTDTHSRGISQALNGKPNLQDKDTDYDEMEHWLATHSAQQNSETHTRQEPITSSGNHLKARSYNHAYSHLPKEDEDGSLSAEFDRFLTERATAAENLPSITAHTGQNASTTRTTRTLQKKEDDENPLFAL